MLATESGGATADLEPDKGAQAGYFANTCHAGREQVRRERRTAGDDSYRGTGRGGRLGSVLYGNVGENEPQCHGTVPGEQSPSACLHLSSLMDVEHDEGSGGTGVA